MTAGYTIYSHWEKPHELLQSVSSFGIVTGEFVSQFKVQFPEKCYAKFISPAFRRFNFARHPELKSWLNPEISETIYWQLPSDSLAFQIAHTKQLASEEYPTILILGPSKPQTSEEAT